MQITDSPSSILPKVVFVHRSAHQLSRVQIAEKQQSCQARDEVCVQRIEDVRFAPYKVNSGFLKSSGSPILPNEESGVQVDETQSSSFSLEDAFPVCFDLLCSKL